MNCDRVDLAEFGTGYPLYFEFVFYCIIMLTIMLVFLGLYSMISNYSTDDCLQAEANCNAAYWYNLVSVPNKILHEYEYFVQTWVNLVTIVIIMISLHVFRRIQRLTEKECDRGLVSPSDYSIWLGNLPKGEYSEEDIRKLLMDHKEKFEDFNAKKIVLAYDITEFMRDCRDLNSSEAKIMKGREYEDREGKWPEGGSLGELEAQKETLERKVSEFIKQTEAVGGKMLGKTSGDVFVVFEAQNSIFSLFSCFLRFFRFSGK